MYTVFSSSLNRDSLSRILAHSAREQFAERGIVAEWVDLAELDLPMCDAGDCYSHPATAHCVEMVQRSKGIILASPVYNYDVSAAAKNLVELTGRAWTGKVVGFMLTAGGSGSYMSVMGLANSLMLDFRVTVVPRFVYATGECFVNGQVKNEDVARRIGDLVSETIRFAEALTPDESP